MFVQEFHQHPEMYQRYLPFSEHQPTKLRGFFMRAAEGLKRKWNQLILIPLFVYWFYEWDKFIGSIWWPLFDHQMYHLGNILRGYALSFFLCHHQNECYYQIKCESVVHVSFFFFGITPLQTIFLHTDTDCLSLNDALQKKELSTTDMLSSIMGGAKIHITHAIPNPTKNGTQTLTSEWEGWNNILLIFNNNLMYIHINSSHTNKSPK